MLQNDHHNKSSYHLSLYKVIILLLAIFCMLDKPERTEHQLALMSWFYTLKNTKKPKVHNVRAVSFSFIMELKAISLKETAP